jgi:hypothetical protein
MKLQEIADLEILFSRKNDSRLDRNYDKTALTKWPWGLTGLLIE